MNTPSGRSGSMHFTGSSPGVRPDPSPSDAQTETSADTLSEAASSNALFFNDNDTGSTP